MSGDRGSNAQRSGGFASSAPAWIGVARHFVPSTRLEVGIVCVMAIASFGLTVLVTASMHGIGNAMGTGLLLAAYATPILAAWPGTWVAWALTTTKATTFSMRDGCISLGDERIPVEELAGCQVTPASSGAFVFLQRPQASEAIVLEVYESSAALLPKMPSFGVVKFAVRTRARWTFARLVLGAGCAWALLEMKDWGIFLLFFAGAILVPVLWILMLLDFARRHLEVTGNAVRLDGEWLAVLPRIRATLDGNVLTLEALDLERARNGRVRLRSYVQPFWGRQLRFVKASIDAAVAGFADRT